MVDIKFSYLKPDFQLSSQDLIVKHGSEVKAVSHLVERAKNLDLMFPYRKLFTNNPKDLFRRLQTYQPKYDTTHYHLHAYRARFKLFLPPFFLGRKGQSDPIQIRETTLDYEDINALQDIYFEDVRIRAPYKNQLSLLNVWTSPEKCEPIMARCLRFQNITWESLRTTLSMLVREPRQFRPTWAVSILKILLSNFSVVDTNITTTRWERLLQPQCCILDLTAGYGSVLLASMALDCEYIGFVEHNQSLLNGYEEMILQLGYPNRQRIIPNSFLEFDEQIPVDIVFLTADLTPADFLGYLVQSLFPSLQKVWEMMSMDGYLVLYMPDTKKKCGAEATNLFIEQFLLGSSFEGCIGLSGSDLKARPAWIWKKTKPSERNIWSPPPTKRTFFLLYPELKDLIVGSHLARIDLDLSIKFKHNKQILADLITQIIDQVPGLTKKTLMHIVPESMLLELINKYGFIECQSMIIKILQYWTPPLLQGRIYHASAD